ncbi:MAG: type II toxin-antitoxin system HicA family toxin [Candidatus Methanoperedens sp.]
MNKLPVISGKKAINFLERAGFVIVRQRGSHVRMKTVTSEKTIKLTIPLH